MRLQPEQAQYDWRFGYDAKRVKGLVDFQIYTDDLAKEMGVLPPLMKIFFQKPKLWMSIMFGPVRLLCVCVCVCFVCFLSLLFVDYLHGPRFNRLTNEKKALFFRQAHLLGIPTTPTSIHTGSIKQSRWVLPFIICCSCRSRPYSPRPPLPREQFTMHQYRLTGPYANPKVAAEVYSRQPMGDFLECSITAGFLGASKVSYLVHSALPCL